MRKSKTNISVADNTGARRTVDLILGDAAGYASGDILDANAVEKKINDVIGIAPEDLDTIAEAAEAIVGMQGEIDDIENSVDSVQEKVGNESVAPYKANYVDLGLTSGNLWATCNLGASSPEEAGKYYQWGDTQGYTADQVGSGEGKKEFTWDDYKFGTPENISKYNDTDGLTELQAVDDAATAELGAPWKIPTTNDWQELIDECTWTWKQVNGVSGYKIVGTNGNKIFIPTGGVAQGEVQDKNTETLCWTRIVNEPYRSGAYFVNLNRFNKVVGQDIERSLGCTIRPIATSIPPSQSQSITDVLNKHSDDLNALTNPPAPVPETPKVINPAWLENGFYIVRANSDEIAEKGSIVWIEFNCAHGGFGISWGFLVGESGSIIYWNGEEFSTYDDGLDNVIRFTEDVIRQIYYEKPYDVFASITGGQPIITCLNTGAIPCLKAIIGEPFQ